MIDDAHGNGSRCAAAEGLGSLHSVEIAVALDALPEPVRDDVARVIGFPTGLDLAELRDGVIAQSSSLDPTEAHALARFLVSPLVPTLLAHIDDGHGPLTRSLEAGVLALLEEWPPALVHLLVTLVWEAAGLPAGALPGDDFSTSEPPPAR